MHSIFFSLHHCFTSFCSLFFLVLILVILSFIPSPPFRLYNPDPFRSKFRSTCSVRATKSSTQSNVPTYHLRRASHFKPHQIYILSIPCLISRLPFFFFISSTLVSLFCAFTVSPQPFTSRRTSTVRPPFPLHPLARVTAPPPHFPQPNPPLPSRHPRHERLTQNPSHPRLHTLCHPMPPYALRSSFLVSMPFPFCSFSLSLPPTPRSCLLTYYSPVQRPRFQRCSHSPTP